MTVGCHDSDPFAANSSFQHATWFAEEGFVENQSGAAACAGFFGPVDPADLDQRIKGNVRMANAARIAFDRCEFAHLGANALDLAHGAHDNIVQDCLFRDISAAAVQIGRTDGLTQKLTDAEVSTTCKRPSRGLRFHADARCVAGSRDREYHLQFDRLQPRGRVPRLDGDLRRVHNRDQPLAQRRRQLHLRSYLGRLVSLILPFSFSNNELGCLS